MTEKKIDTTKAKTKSRTNSGILKPQGIAVWLLNHYPDLTSMQIAKFCNLDLLKVGFLKNEIENGKIYAQTNPILMGYVTKDDLDNALDDPSQSIKLNIDHSLKAIKRSKRKYVSFIDRKNKIAASLWLLNFYKKLPLTGEDIKSITGASIVSIRKLMTDKKYALSVNPIDPIKSNVCTQQDIEKVISKYL